MTTLNPRQRDIFKGEMKKLPRQLFAVLIMTSIGSISLGQEVHEIQITPLEPTSADTISVISDFSYYGACEYGLVYSYAYSNDTSIFITPTYCGYFLPDSTLCQSIDTFKIGPFPAGTYALRITYHQGSICPISDFDATIAEFDTSLTISGTNAVYEPTLVRGAAHLEVYPNPAESIITIRIKDYSASSSAQLVITDALGQQIFRRVIHEEMNLDASTWTGVYFLRLLGTHGNTLDFFKLVVH